MNRFFLIAAFYALFSTISQVAAQGIVVSGKTGLHLPDLVSQEADWNFDSDPSVHLGLALMVYSSDLFALQTGLDLMQFRGEGVRSTPNGNSTSVENLGFRFNYWEVPIFARFSYGNKVRASGFAGPIMGFLGNKKADYERFTQTQNGLPSNLQTENWENQITDFNVSMALGLTVEFLNIFLEFRYAWGLTDIASQTDSSFRTRNLSISSGYLLYF